MKIAVLLMAAYFLGNFSPAFFLGKLTANIDIREHGSGNAGTTNVMRVLGVKLAILVLICDLLKGVLAVWMGRYFSGETMAGVCGLLAVIGHNWPVLLRFKGGKGVATTMGVGFMIHPQLAWICLVVAIVIIIITRYVSLASMSGVLLWTVLLWKTNGESAHIWLGIALSLLVFYRHRSNIKRIFNGTENRFDVKKS
ncbi:glycerol-3-phosphate 1-O-acyltransferase PlsY [Anoxynatronum buryatiense]|uniref:Glycerol-3-phosphate acyltransferase n=1 Tax=Anoxynatronum buryatiense TaxID=489973 RepID=A0AA45WUH7_9CLOT|nr:glycerol-3-phosphate 1-O-acyltransferase PlsY [Anoxynatronum buryatiense]SMP46740.1 acyl-phosphate glycerol-3-phosphate acyltransferase [Anoxynatronum buryatiense]